MAFAIRDLSDDANFLAAPGELARLIREKDWSKTALGPIRSWP